MQGPKVLFGSLEKLTLRKILPNEGGLAAPEFEMLVSEGSQLGVFSA